eukprot:TRINITY_DN19757_c0_g1::TRINITY_DN19757_c0_g1_i1::g.11290::m.11290 TRINITY_DN19757_c0_g1::TRINITY_DN19757_c0_g1_i1::g.11290  ORF type:complete len:425 (+),score=3.24 TRINITY_DN19757_c0_g1_i1:143-1417(+)
MLRNNKDSKYQVAAVRLSPRNAPPSARAAPVHEGRPSEGNSKSHVPTMIQMIYRGLRFSLNMQTCFLLAVSILATFCCTPKMLDWRVEISMTLVSTGVIFPLTYSITTSYNRREKSLEALASLKATMVNLYYTYQNWDRQPQRMLLQKLTDILMKLSEEIEAFLSTEENDAEHLDNIYALFSTLSRLNEMLGSQAGYGKGGEGGMSRVNQYMRFVVYDFEKLRFLRDYRTPRGLVYFTAMLHYLLPVLLAPHFVGSTDPDKCPIEDYPYGCPSMYCNSGLYVIITSTLFMVQYSLEDPYDRHGEDDIRLAILAEVGGLSNLDFDPSGSLTSRDASPDSGNKSRTDFAPVPPLPHVPIPNTTNNNANSHNTASHSPKGNNNHAHAFTHLNTSSPHLRGVMPPLQPIHAVNSDASNRVLPLVENLN